MAASVPPVMSPLRHTPCSTITGASMRIRHRETHRTDRIGWLRAAVLGANDGIVSTASLVVGVAAADIARGDVLVTGMAGLVAGALSMAAGEYVSVSSQADTERADLARERTELATDLRAEENELAGIYMRRGVEPALARTVALQLMARDAWPRTRATSSGSRRSSRPGLCRPHWHRRQHLRSERRCRFWPSWLRRTDGSALLLRARRCSFSRGSARWRPGWVGRRHSWVR